MIKNKYPTQHLLLAVSCVLVFFPVLGHQFQLLWDDQWMVLNKYTFNGLTWSNIQAIFTEPFYGQYAPVNQFFYTMIYHFFGQNPAVFHLYSLLLHIANTCLVFLFIYRLLAWSKRTDNNNAITVSFCVAFLFGIHPLQVETVAWISASKVVLYSFFTLVALLAYLQYTCTTKVKYFAFALVFFILSLGSKEQSVVLPVSLILLDWVMKRDLKEKDIWIEKIPFILFAIFFGLFTLSLQSAPLVEKWAGYTFFQRLIFASYAIVEYIVKLIIPANLLYLYPFPMPPGEALPLRMFIYPFIILVFIVWILICRKQWPIIFGVFFFVINIALTVHVAPMSRYNLVADRYIYLPSIGLTFIGVWYAVPYILSIRQKWRKWYFVIIACYLLYLGIYAHQRTKVWYDSDTLKKEMRDLLNERSVQEKNL